MNFVFRFIRVPRLRGHGPRDTRDTPLASRRKGRRRRAPVGGSHGVRDSRREPEPALFPKDAYEYAEKVVSEELGAGEFFVGNRLSIADLAVATVFVNLRHAGFPPAPAKFPKLAAFVARMHARPSFKALIEEERPVFGKRWR